MNAGDTATFRTPFEQIGDYNAKDLHGQTVTIMRPLTEEEADLIETGPMYHVKTRDGCEFAAYEDELDGSIWLPKS